MRHSVGGIATDILGGKSVSVHRLGCNDNGTMLPQHPPGELVKGGDMEAITDQGPGMLLSNHHSGPWYVAEGGAEVDPLNPGHLLPHGKLTDERVRVAASTAVAHGGRRSVRERERERERERVCVCVIV